MAENIDDESFKSFCNQFVEVTKTDLALAHYYLQRNHFELNLALEDYKSQEHVVIRGFTVPVSETYELNRLKVMSWNLEGTEVKDRKSRTKAAIEVIKSCEANIIFLQELVKESFLQISESLKNEYEFFIDESSKLTYFCGIVVKRNRNISINNDSFEVRPFSKSSSSRHLLTLSLSVNGIDLKVITSHLESTQEFSEERKTQLKEAFEEMKSSELSIFAGDLNLRDKEILEVGGLPNNIVDVWEETGAKDESRSTWDPKHNFNASLCCPGAAGQRFDRMYIRSSNELLTPFYFELEGLEKIDRGIRYPSDHWAIVGYFEL